MILDRLTALCVCAISGVGTSLSVMIAVGVPIDLADVGTRAMAGVAAVVGIAGVLGIFRRVTDRAEGQR